MVFSPRKLGEDFQFDEFFRWVGSIQPPISSPSSQLPGMTMNTSAFKASVDSAGREAEEAVPWRSKSIGMLRKTPRSKALIWDS